MSARPLRFDRNELAGAFGDLGTDFPLIVGMILASHLDSASVLIAYGVMQVATGLVYRLPMPVQPLKAVAVLVITQHIAGNVIYGAGLAIGLAMLLLAGLGLIDWLARTVPKSVVRGIQLGLGLQLASLALREYVVADQAAGWALATIAFAITVALIGNRKLPAALLVVGLGIAYALAFQLRLPELAAGIGFSLPQAHVPTWQDIGTGFVVLALPQIPLSLGNSILATEQIVQDYYPGERVGARKIAFTYAGMNLLTPFLSGLPVCHGSGGFAGHYAFGGRTGGSVVLYGGLFVVLGLLFSNVFTEVVKVFPLPILGVLLLFEALALIVLVRDLADSRVDFTVAALVAVCAAFLPYGYVIGLVLGTGLAYLSRRGLIGLARN
jgi:hypothetical protein